MIKILIPISEYASKIGLKTDTIKHYILQGKIPGVKMANRWFIDENYTYIPLKKNNKK